MSLLQYLNKTIDKDLNLCLVPSSTGLYLYSTIEYKYKQFIERIYALKYTKAKGIQWQEVLCYCESGLIYGKNCYYNWYGQSSGFKVFFSKKYRNCYDGELSYSDVLERYADKFPINKVYRNELFNINDIIALDNSCKYCAYEYNKYIRFIDYIRLYRKYPVAEMCMKLKLYRLCTEKALDKLTNDKTFAKWVFKNKEELHEMSYQHTVNAYKKHQPPLDYYNSLQYRIHCGQEISIGIKEIFKYTTQEKVYDYLKANDIKKQSYNDYLTACKWLRLDLTDTKVLFPHNFQEMHDTYTRQYSNHLVEMAKEKNEGIAQKMEMTAIKYSYCNYKGADYTIIVARTKQDLINEGSALSHCVGRMDYDLRQAEETSLICFMRKNNELFTPYCTIELGLKDFKIKQCYGYKDSVIEGIEGFKNEWLKAIKKRAKIIRTVVE